MTFLNIFAIFCLIGSVASLDNGLARLPPMGWMSWSRFYCEIDCEKHPNGCINENLYMVHADRLVSDGFKDVGYTEIHIDDCWPEKQRDKDGRWVPDKKRFPSGMPALAKYVRGLKLGIYTDVGQLTCANYPASEGHEDVDAQTLADWKIDYVKVDGCNATVNELETNFPKFSKSLNATGAAIVYSCEWPLYEYLQKTTPNYTEIAAACNLFRNEHDVDNNWKSVLDIIEFYVTNQETFIKFHGPGQWFDPDMLVIGNGLTLEESRTQMAVWSIWSAPLIMSNDLRVLEQSLVEVLQNKDVIAVDQDPLGVMGKMVKKSGDIYVFTKPMTPFIDMDKERVFSFGIVLMNKGDQTNSISFKFSDLGLTNKAGYTLKELWMGKKIGDKMPNDTHQVNIGAHDSIIYKATLLNGNSKDDNNGTPIQSLFAVVLLFAVLTIVWLW